MTEVEPSLCGQLIIYQALGDLETTGGGNGVLGLGGEQHPSPGTAKKREDRM